MKTTKYNYESNVLWLTCTEDFNVQDSNVEMLVEFGKLNDINLEFKDLPIIKNSAPKMYEHFITSQYEVNNLEDESEAINELTPIGSSNKLKDYILNQIKDSAIELLEQHRGLVIQQSCDDLRMKLSSNVDNLSLVQSIAEVDDFLYDAIKSFRKKFKKSGKGGKNRDIRYS